MGFDLSKVLSDDIKYYITSLRTAEYDAPKRPDGLPDYKKMVNSSEYDVNDVAKFLVNDYYEVRRDSVIIMPSEDGRTPRLLSRILRIIRSNDYNDNRRLLLTCFDVKGRFKNLANILLLNEFYFESVIAYIMSVKASNNHSVVMNVWYDPEFPDKFPEIFPKLSADECEIVLELLNNEGMTKEVAVLLDVCKKSKKNRTSYDL